MIGSQVGSYKILEKLGEGGMGVVYKAVDTSLERIVALKALSAELVNNPDLEKRFRAEARAQANLNHTNIATLYAFLVEGGVPWMVMEFIEGESLAEMIGRRGLLPWAEAVPLFKQALLGIGYAHRMGIVHRDIKPSNIMVNRAGIVKVMDFGIAKVLGNRGMTRTGTQMGTAYYMSPEQVVNRGVDIRSDIYSLGVTLYEMLTANLPFAGDTDFEVMQAHMQTPPPLPTRFYPYIPKGIENAVLRAIEKSQAARFQTVEEFGAALEHPQDYVAPVAGPVAGGPALAGATRLEGVTQTIGGPPVAGRPSNPGVTATIGTPLPIGPLTPPPPPPPKASFLSSRNGIIAMAGGGVAIVAVAGALMFHKPQPNVGGTITPPSSPSAPAQPQAQVEVQVPAPVPADPGQPQALPQPGQTQPPEAAQNKPPDKKKTPQQAQQTASVQPPQQQPQAQAPPQAPASRPPVNDTPKTASTPGTAQPPAAAPAPIGVSASPAAASSPVAVMSPVTIAAGTRITIRTIGLASARSNKEGDSVPAIVDAPVFVGGRQAIPRGAQATLRVASLADGIVLTLADIGVAGRHYAANADPYDQGGSATKDKKGNKVAGVFRHLDPLKKRGGDQAAAVVTPESRITFTLRQPLEVVAP